MDNDEFNQAANRVTTLKNRPNSATLLKLYGLYKQASQGDAPGSRPGILQITARKKYDAWANQKGMDSEDATRQYVELVRDLVEADG